VDNTANAGLAASSRLRDVRGARPSSVPGLRVDATVAQAVQSAERTARDDNAGRVGEFLARAQAEREGWGPAPACAVAAGVSAATIIGSPLIADSSKRNPRAGRSSRQSQAAGWRHHTWSQGV
jgi:hypothetical protein